MELYLMLKMPAAGLVKLGPSAALFTLLRVRLPANEAPSMALYSSTDDGVPLSPTWFDPPHMTLLTTMAPGEFSR